MACPSARPTDISKARPAHGPIDWRPYVQLKFASYNIHKAIGADRKRDPMRIISVLREIDADVIALQEADLRLGQRATVLPRAALQDTDWKVVEVARRPQSIGWHGNALLVRRSIEIMHGQALDLPTLEPRGAVSAELVAEGKRFRVVGMHLDLSGFRRREQLHAVIDHLAEARPRCPEVVMGDYNRNPQSALKLRTAYYLGDCTRAYLSKPPHLRR